MQYRQRAWAEISLDALAQNVVHIRSSLPSGTAYMAVVKADAYGHGEEQICRRLGDMGISCERRTVGKDMKVLREQGFEIMSELTRVASPAP